MTLPLLSSSLSSTLDTYHHHAVAVNGSEATPLTSPKQHHPHPSLQNTITVSPLPDSASSRTMHLSSPSSSSSPPISPSASSSSFPSMSKAETEAVTRSISEGVSTSPPPPPPAFSPSPSPNASRSRSRSPSPSRASSSHSAHDPPPNHIPIVSSPPSPSHASLLAPGQASSSSKHSISSGPQLIDRLPVAQAEAMSLFQEIQFNDYHDKKLGKSKGKFSFDPMLCECPFRPGHEDDLACTEESECINRLTQIECLASECKWGKKCHNQRFQQRQYAPIEIVLTENKGFGLRAAKDLVRDTFIYEYVGEVMNHPTFLGRMQQYRLEGIRHFYFMMLQKDEYIDATKKGGKARFINHSCNPNCFVAKWQVGKHMRMGIFAKRKIIKGEELTFNYNVDRYGNDAQICFCGEANCVGTLGGKTQTDINGMADLFIDALGIADQVELTEARGNRKKRGKKLDLDFIPNLLPIQDHEVTKVMTAIRQTAANRQILQKLLSRIEMTQDIQVQKLLVKLHGFALMAVLLEDWKSDKEIVMLILSALVRWPLIARNKVVDSGIEQQVKDVLDIYKPKSEAQQQQQQEEEKVAVKKEDKVKGHREEQVGQDSSIKKQETNLNETVTVSDTNPIDSSQVSLRASQLLDAWDKLDFGYRIARKENGGATGGEGERDADASNAEMPSYFDRRRLGIEFESDPIQLEAEHPESEARAPNAVSEELERALPSSSWRSGDDDYHSHRQSPHHHSHSQQHQQEQQERRYLNRPPPGHPLPLPRRLPRSPAVFSPRNGGGFSHSAVARNSPHTPDSGLPPHIASSLAPTSAPTPKSIEDIIREANEQAELERKMAETKAKAEATVALAASTSFSSLSSSSRKHPRTSSRSQPPRPSSEKRRKSGSTVFASRTDPRSHPTAPILTTIGVDFNQDGTVATPITTTAEDATALSSSRHVLNNNDNSNNSDGHEHKLRKLVGEIVVHQMSKHKDQFDRDVFKKYAKELTQIIVTKEMKNPKHWPPPTGTRVQEFSHDKKHKIKSFANEYIEKLLLRKGKRGL